MSSLSVAALVSNAQSFAVTFFGAALRAEQVQRFTASLVFFFFLHAVFWRLLPRCVPADRWDALSTLDRHRVCGWAIAGVHATITSCGALYVLLRASGTIWDDRIYGEADGAMMVYAFTGAFLLFDFTMVFRAPSIDLSFVTHHAAGLLTALTLQAPYVQMYGLCCVLFEMSTPFLCLRSTLLALGYKGTRRLQVVERLFGYTFLACRLLFGLPVSAMGIYEGTAFMLGGGMKCMAHYYVIFVNIVSLNALNVLWFAKILKLGAATPKPKGA